MVSFNISPPKNAIEGLINRANRSPEFELLLCCARTSLTQQQAERIETLLQQSIDWQFVIELAVAHGVMPLLAKSLNTVCPEAIPNEVLQQLRIYCYQLTLKNLSLTGELCKLIQLLNRHNIPAIPFKGPLLAVSVYGNVALRQFSDLDILVRPQDFLAARTLLMSKAGYCAKESHFLTTAQELAYLQSSYECSLFSPDQQVVIDLHQELSGGTFFSYPVQFEQLWERLEPISTIGNKLHSLSSDDLLLYLCVHGAKSRWERLGWICDVAELIRVQPQIDWEQVFEKAKTSNCERMLLLGLQLAHTLLDTPLAEAIAQQIQADSTCQLLATQVCEQIQSNTQGLTKKFTLKMLMFQLRVLDRQSDRRDCCYQSFVWHGLKPLYRLINPTLRDYQFLPLPQFLHIIYYFIRPFRLVYEYGKTLQKQGLVDH
jgi:hypothetical protein